MTTINRRILLAMGAMIASAPTLAHIRKGMDLIKVRAVDETGYMHPARAELLALRGPGTATYHLNPITGWSVRADGRVFYNEEAWG